jgi:hypothetical protein
VYLPIRVLPQIKEYPDALLFLYTMGHVMVAGITVAGFHSCPGSGQIDVLFCVLLHPVELLIGVAVIFNRMTMP